jgi:hypothetical protein
MLSPMDDRLCRPALPSARYPLGQFWQRKYPIILLPPNFATPLKTQRTQALRPYLVVFSFLETTLYLQLHWPRCKKEFAFS